MKFNPLTLMNPIAAWKHLLLPLGCALALSLSAVPLVHATDLPPGVLNYLRLKDPRVKVRFDAVVMFSNGETYVPVIPQDPSLSPDSQVVVATMPEKVAYPDLIQFDNNFFLMRLIQTASGRLTFPKMAEYPIQLKEGLLPQDFVLPDNLYIPVELKVILGALPYNPNNGVPPKTPVTPNPPAALLPKGDAISSNPVDTVLRVDPAHPFKSMVRLTYVFDLTEQKLIGIDTLTGRKQGDVPLDCVPSSLKLSGDGKLLFAPCLTTNELVVIDTGSNLIKTRISVGQRPDAVLYLESSQDVVVSNRYSPFLSLLNSNELVTAQKIDLPGNGGAMTLVPGGKTPQVMVADAFKSQIYLVDLNSRAVVKTLKAVEDMSALRVFRDTQGQLRIWAVSRTKGQLVVIDVDSDKILKTITVGAKPVDMTTYGDKLYVVSAGANQVDVVDRATQTIVTTIPLEADAFPSGMVTMNDQRRAYVVTAAANSLVVINLDTNKVENTFPVDFRANMIATVPDPIEFTPEAVSPIAPVESTGPDKDKKVPAGDKSPGKRHGFFGKPEPAKPDSSKADAKLVAPSVTKSAQAPVKPQGQKPKTAQGPKASQGKVKPAAQPVSSDNSKSDGAGILAAPVVIPTQPGSALNSPLYGESSGKLRLNFGRNKQAAKKPIPAEATPTQAAKAGARLANPIAPNLPANTAKPEDTPNSLLMMAPDVEK